MRHLLKNGTLPVQNLIDIWTAINDEYRTLSSDTDTNHTFDLYKELKTTDKDILLVTIIVNQLRLRRNEELISFLRNRFNFHFKYVDLEVDLNKTLTVAKGWLLQLKLKEKDYNELKSAENSGKEITQFDFIEQLTVLSEDVGYHLKSNTLTVAEYIAIFNRFKAKVEIKLKNAR